MNVGSKLPETNVESYKYGNGTQYEILETAFLYDKEPGFLLLGTLNSSIFCDMKVQCNDIVII
jgi:hypothetical protein